MKTYPSRHIYYKLIYTVAAIFAIIQPAYAGTVEQDLALFEQDLALVEKTLSYAEKNKSSADFQKTIKLIDKLIKKHREAPYRSVVQSSLIDTYYINSLLGKSYFGYATNKYNNIDSLPQSDAIKHTNILTEAKQYTSDAYDLLYSGLAQDWRYGITPNRQEGDILKTRLSEIERQLKLSRKRTSIMTSPSPSSSACQKQAEVRVTRCWKVLLGCDVVGNCEYRVECNHPTGECDYPKVSTSSNDYYCDSRNPNNWSSDKENVIANICDQ